MTRQNNWYRNAKRFDREAEECVQRIKKEKEDELKKNLPYFLEARRIRIEKRNIRNNEIFDAMKKGDTLVLLNLPNVTIKKKNRKSIIDTDGHKWTSKEIFHHN